MKDLRRLMQAAALAEHGHFGRAAKSLGISQPALTLAIQSLERDLGVRLFDRSQARATPTDAGRVVLKHGDSLLDNAREMLREISLMQKLETGQLVVTTGTYAAELSGNAAIGKLISRYPGVKCRLWLRDWQSTVAPVLDREADLALADISAAEIDGRLVAQPVANHPCVFFCRAGHPILRVRRPMLEQIASHPWAMTPLPPRIFENFDMDNIAAGAVDKKTNRFIPAVHVDTLHSAKPVVRHSNAIGGGPLALLQREIADGELVPLAFTADWLRLNYGFIYLRDKTLSPAARAYMDEVRKVEAAISVN